MMIKEDKGIITKTDIVELYAYHQPRHITVYECMSDKVHSVAPDESIHMIASLMNIHKISRVRCAEKYETNRYCD